MRSSLTALTALLALLGGPAAAQNSSILAELRAAESDQPNLVTARALENGGPLFVLVFGNSSVSAWPARVVGEPIVTPYGRPIYAFGSFALGDVDGDGLTDLALAGIEEIVLLRGDGTGRFTPAGTIPTSEQLFDLVAADFDGDGRDDIAADQTEPGLYPAVSVFLSKGGFQFEGPRKTQVTTFSTVVDLSAGDLDGDGLADLVVTPADGGVSVWIGKGDGTFVQSGSSLLGIWPGPTILADIDGDGRPDILYFDQARVIPPYVDVYKNDGGGLFHSIATIDTYSLHLGGFVVADLDGDGKDEIVFSGADSTAAYLSVYKYSSGAFTTTRISLPASPPLLVQPADAAADWNGDGRAELLLLTDGGVDVLGVEAPWVDVLSVPVLVSTTGLYDTRFDSDLLITNSGTTPAHLTMRFVASKGGGSGTLERDIPAGQQLFASSAVEFLREAGLAISTEENVVGTLRIETTGASSPRAVCATVRTTTPAHAGVSYEGVPSLALLRGPSVVPWLIESATDRTNLGLVNAGSDADGPITLRVTVFSGTPGTEAPVATPDVVLTPGAFFQFNGVLSSAGLSSLLGWARIDRIAGNAPYLAWGSVNDAGSGDGSFIPAVPEAAEYVGPWIVPNAAQTSRYGTEFIATNAGTRPLLLQVTLVTTGTVLTETVAPGATFYVPDLFAEMRRRGLAGAPAPGATVVSPLFLNGGSGLAKLYAGIRVSTSAVSGRRYGVFEPAMPQELLGGYSMVVPDLRQDADTRTNLGIVNLRGKPANFRIDVFDGLTGELAGTTSRDLQPNELVQLNAVLRDVAPGVTRAWARMTPVIPPPAVWPFAAYAILDDGATPGAGTDDGSYVAGVPQ